MKKLEKIVQKDIDEYYGKPLTLSAQRFKEKLRRVMDAHDKKMK